MQKGEERTLRHRGALIHVRCLGSNERILGRSPRTAIGFLIRVRVLTSRLEEARERGSDVDALVRHTFGRSQRTDGAVMEFRRHNRHPTNAIIREDADRLLRTAKGFIDVMYTGRSFQTLSD